MDNLTPFKGVYVKTKARYIDKSFQYLALKPELLNEAKTDQELIERVVAFAENLYKYDPNGELL